MTELTLPADPDQAGWRMCLNDVWQLADGRTCHLVSDKNTGLLYAVWGIHKRAIQTVTDIDLTGGQLLYRASANSRQLRRLMDGDRDEWVETSPGSDTYHSAGMHLVHRCQLDRRALSHEETCAMDRERIAAQWPPITEMSPIDFEPARHG